MADNNLTISVGADSTKLRADLAVAQAQVKEFGAQLRAAAKESLATGDRSQVTALAEQYDGAVARVKTLKAAIATTATEHRSLREIGKEAFSTLREHTAAFGESVSVLSERVFPRLKEVLALTAAGAAAEFLHLTTEAANNVRQTDNMAKALGFTTEAWEGMKLVAAQSGVDVDLFGAAMARSARAVGQAREELIKSTGQMPGPVNVMRGAIGQVSSAVETLRGGVKNLSADLQAGVEVFHGSAQAIPDFSKPLSGLRIDLKRFTDDAKGNLEVQAEIAKRLTAMGDSSIKAAIGQQQFGRGWRNIIAALVDFKPRLDAAMEAMEHSGLAISDQERKQAAVFNAELGVMRVYVERVKDIIGNGLGQALIPVFKEVQQLLTQNSGAIREWASDTGKQLAEVSRDFIAMFKGAGKDQLNTDFAKSFVAAKDLIVGSVNTIRSVVRPLIAVFDGLAYAINTVTLGTTKLNGPTLLVVAALLKMSGLLGVIVRGAKLVGSVFVAIAEVIGWPVTLLGSLVALDAYLLVFGDGWKNLKAAFGGMKELAEALGGYIAGAFVAAWNTAVDGIKAAWQGLVDWFEQKIDAMTGWIGSLIDKVKAAASSISSLFSSSSGSGAGGDNPFASGGFASGGYVSGPGSGTSDSIPARLSDGEYVVRASAVRRIGVPALNRINYATGGLVSAVRGFATGGLVSAVHLFEPLGFAAGGAVPALAHAASGGGSHVHLTIGDRTFGLRGDEDVVSSLAHAARQRQMVSAGRKPGWFQS